MNIAEILSNGWIPIVTILVTGGVGYAFGGRSKNKRDDFSAIVAQWATLENTANARLIAALADRDALMARFTVLEKESHRAKEAEEECNRKFAALEKDRLATKQRISELEAQMKIQIAAEVPAKHLLAVAAEAAANLKQGVAEAVAAEIKKAV